jgi:hypothetical protein
VFLHFAYSSTPPSRSGGRGLPPLLLLRAASLSATSPHGQPLLLPPHRSCALPR